MVGNLGEDKQDELSGRWMDKANSTVEDVADST